MTCVIGLVEGGEVWMGADSAGCDGWELTLRRDPKVFRRGDFLFSFTSSFRMGQLLAHKLQIPDHPEGMDAHDYMVAHFVEAVRTCLKDGGFATKEKEAEEGGGFLVGYRGRIFTVCRDYQVSESLSPFAACGCGSQAALGALTILSVMDWEPEEKVRAALRVAEGLSAGVRGPFTVLNSKEDG